MADLSKDKTSSLFLNRLLLGLICIGIQGIYIKLNHSQAIMIKLQITFKELRGLILSQGHLAKGL